MKAGLGRIVAGTILAIFVGTLFFSLYHLASGMTMDGSMTDCPYMSHDAVICPMNLLDHIDAWKVAFASVIPSIFSLAALLIAAVVLVSIAPNLLQKVRLWLLRVTISVGRRWRPSFIVRPLQELFSNGILHPKVF